MDSSMRLQSLHHLIEVVRAVGRPHRVTLLGSSSLLATYPDLGEGGRPLELTTAADFLLEPVNAAIAESLQFAAGADSAFLKEFGYYADILHPDIVETLPSGWETRVNPVAGYNNVFALDLYDLALVKLIVGRPKDLELLQALLRLGLLDIGHLRQHYQATPLGEHEAGIAGRNLAALNSQLSASPMTLDLATLFAGTEQAKLADLPQYEAAAVSAVPPGADVTLTGRAPVWLYLRIAHALHGRVRILSYDSPVTGPVEIFNHNPK